MLFIHLDTIYWKSGIFLLDLSPGLSAHTHWNMIGFQFIANFYAQMTILTVILYNFNVAGFSVQGGIVLLLELLLSDLAVLVYLRNLAISKHGKVFSVKFEHKNEFSSFQTPPGADRNFHYVYSIIPSSNG